MIGPAMRRAVLCLCAVLPLAGCGHPGGTDPVRTNEAEHDAMPLPGVTQDEHPPAIPTPVQPKPPARPRLPGRVPRHATGAAADTSAKQVVRRWSAALRHGQIARAAAYFAQPSKVQNGTPVLTLRSRAQRLAFNVSFPCGAVPTRYGAAGRFTIVTFRLTERVGGDCQGAAGHHARSAIRVAHGRIAEWYRLADPPRRSAPDRPLSTIGGAA
jgi:hypothetical protein